MHARDSKQLLFALFLLIRGLKEDKNTPISYPPLLSDRSGLIFQASYSFQRF